jgi:hypothetical protein
MLYMLLENCGLVKKSLGEEYIKGGFLKFNVFHVRALYYTKTLITNKCTKSFIINCNTLLHVSTLLGHLQGELFCYLYTKVALYSSVRMCC